MIITTPPNYYVRRNNRRSKEEERIPKELAENQMGEDPEIRKEDNDDLPITLRKSTQARVKPLPSDVENFLNYRRASPNYKCFLTALRQWFHQQLKRQGNV